IHKLLDKGQKILDLEQMKHGFWTELGLLWQEQQNGSLAGLLEQIGRAVDEQSPELYARATLAVVRAARTNQVGSPQPELL
ncbi:MAG: hypothetical protein AB1758_05310, partial [Candidatus Eremiobacterota bacterium]